VVDAKAIRMRKQTAIFVAGFLLGLMAGHLFGAPRDEVRAAVADLQANVPQQDWANTRYLSLANVEEKDRASVTVVVGFVANSVGASPAIYPASVSGDLLRLNLATFRINSAAWEALASDREPYFPITPRFPVDAILPIASDASSWSVQPLRWFMHRVECTPDQSLFVAHHLKYSQIWHGSK